MRYTPQQALDFISGTRLFLTTRERIKQPEGVDLFDEAIAVLTSALSPTQARPDGGEPCPDCGNGVGVLFECPACSAKNYPDEPAPTVDGGAEWWCSTCQCVVAPADVTFNEHHACGGLVGERTHPAPAPDVALVGRFNELLQRMRGQLADSTADFAYPIVRGYCNELGDIFSALTAAQQKEATNGQG